MAAQAPERPVSPDAKSELRSLLADLRAAKGRSETGGVSDVNIFKIDMGTEGVVLLLFPVIFSFLLFGLSFAEEVQTCRWTAFAFSSIFAWGSCGGCLACVKMKNLVATSRMTLVAAFFGLLVLVGMLLFGLSFASSEAVRWTAFSFGCLFLLPMAISCRTCCGACCDAAREQAQTQDDLEKAQANFAISVEALAAGLESKASRDTHAADVKNSALPEGGNAT